MIRISFLNIGSVCRSCRQRRSSTLIAMVAATANGEVALYNQLVADSGELAISKSAVVQVPMVRLVANVNVSGIVARGNSAAIHNASQDRKFMPCRPMFAAIKP